MKSKFENKFTAFFGIIAFVFIEILYYFNLLIYESVSISDSIKIMNDPNFSVIFSTLPSLFISVIILVKMHKRYRIANNNVAFFMLLFITFTFITLLSTILSYTFTGPGTLALFFDRTTFISFVTAAYYLYVFMNEVFREKRSH